MKKTELFNNISPDLLKNTKLKPGEQAVYRVNGIQRNPMDPSKWAIPAAKNVPVSDQIWDPIKEEYIDIAAVRSVDPQGNHSFHDLYFYGNQGGHMVLIGGKAVDQEIHSYFSLCNYNGSNPNRDVSKEIIFELVDEGVKSENERKQRNIKREALNAAADLSAEDVKNYTAALGQDDTRKVDILRNELETLADNNPKEFLDLIGNKQAVIKATINRALTKGVILFDSEQSRFTWPNGEVILTVSRTTGGDNVEELLGYCTSNAKGEKVYQTIQSKSKK
jgi:hypothetical protein